jgi:hypothetical protein
MTKSGTALLLLSAILFAACNLPGSGSSEETPTLVLTISVSTATEYRAGPGEAYDLLGVLEPGQEVEAVGRSPEGDYLVIRDPDDPGSLAWLPSDGAITIGNPTGLPTAVPPPMPTLVGDPGSGCPTPVGGGPTPVSCGTGDALPAGSGCPTPVGGGPTPVVCPTPVK